MVNFRYHLISLTAVFLSLGLGLLIGVSLADGGKMPPDAWSVIEDIERHLGMLREENRRLAGELAAREQAAAHQDALLAQLGTEWIGDALKQRRVALFGNGVGEDVMESVRAYMRALGAKTTVVMHVERETTAEQLPPVSSLAAYLIGSELNPALQPYIANGSIRFDGTLQPADAVVILQGKSTLSIAALYEALRLLDATVLVAGVGSLGPAQYHVDPWPSVSHVELAAGRLQLAYYLAAALNEGGK